jgi:hypothetical protein
MMGFTPDQVELAIRSEEANIARARARQMAWLRIADAMQLPTADGARSMREWVSGRLDVSPQTAARLAGTARRIEDRPDLSHSLAEGEMTFDRAEATARIPLTEDDNRLRGLDITGLRRLAAKHRRLTREDDHESHRSQHLHLQPNLDESRWDVWGALDGYGGTVVSKVLTDEADQLERLSDENVGIANRRALALVKICEDTRPASVESPLITVFVDSTGIELEGGGPVGPEILDKVACAGSLEIISEGRGKPLSIGRRSRIIPKKLRRFVLHRDGGCTADGCTSRYRLQPHHIIPWSEGGPTNAENLTTLCWFHHHVVVHGRGYRIDADLGPGRIRFIRPNRDPP